MKTVFLGRELYCCHVEIARYNKFSALSVTNILGIRSLVTGSYSGAPARAKSAPSGAPWVRKFGKLAIPENLVMT